MNNRVLAGAGRLVTLACVAMVTLGGEVQAADIGQASSFSPRLTAPRIAPVSKQGRTPEQEAMLSSRPDYNIYKTLALNTELYDRWIPLTQYLLNKSSLPARDRELVMLRMGWLCQSEYEWAQHARIGKGDPGLTEQDLHRVAVGPTAAGWTDFERTLLQMVDELRYDAMIGDATWQGLRARYSDIQIMDALYTAGQYQLVSMMLNSMGVQLDAVLQDRMPTDVPRPALADLPSGARPARPRIEPLLAKDWSPLQRDLIAPQAATGGALNLYTTILHHPTLYAPRLRFGSYLQRDSKLPARTRELLILRTAWLIRAEYEWAHHAPTAKALGLSDAEIRRIAEGSNASGWSEEHAAVLRAAEELRREAFISDATWAQLTRYYDTKQLLEIIFTVGGYTMTGLALNSFGVQVEPGYPALPR